MRLTDLDLIEFERSAQKMSGGYIIKIDTVKLTCHNFIALTSEIIRIAYDMYSHPYPPKDKAENSNETNADQHEPVAEKTFINK